MKGLKFIIIVFCVMLFVEGILIVVQNSRITNLEKLAQLNGRVDAKQTEIIQHYHPTQP